MPAPSKVATYLSHNMDASGKMLREIAVEAGLPNHNILSMLRTGVTKVPLQRVPSLAKAIGVDPRVLFRLCIEEYSPELKEIFEELSGSKMILSENEEKIITAIRTLSKNLDPAPTKGSKEYLKQFVGQALK